MGLLQFNIFINDLLLMTSDGDICSFADDNTIYQCCSNLSYVKLNIERQCKLVTSWFENNCMKMTVEKYHATILGKEKLPDNFTIKTGDISLSPENQVTLLEVTLDSKLNFEAHIQKMCKEAFKKLNAFLRITSHLNVAQK